MASIRPQDLQREIQRQLEQYSDAIQEGALDKAKEVSAEGVSRLRSTSPERTGKYKSGWSRKQVGNGYVIHNKTHYRLTHLLEKPHLQRNGRMSTPQVHIKPVEEIVIDEYVREVRRVIENA